MSYKHEKRRSIWKTYMFHVQTQNMKTLSNLKSQLREGTLPSAHFTASRSVCLRARTPPFPPYVRSPHSVHKPGEKRFIRMQTPAITTFQIAFQDSRLACGFSYRHVRQFILLSISLWRRLFRHRASLCSHRGSTPVLLCRPSLRAMVRLHTNPRINHTTWNFAWSLRPFRSRSRQRCPNSLSSSMSAPLSMPSMPTVSVRLFSADSVFEPSPFVPVRDDQVSSPTSSPIQSESHEYSYKHLLSKLMRTMFVFRGIWTTRNFSPNWYLMECQILFDTATFCLSICLACFANYTRIPLLLSTNFQTDPTEEKEQRYLLLTLRTACSGNSVGF